MFVDMNYLHLSMSHVWAFMSLLYSTYVYSSVYNMYSYIYTYIQAGFYRNHESMMLLDGWTSPEASYVDDLPGFELYYLLALRTGIFFLSVSIVIQIWYSHTWIWIEPHRITSADMALMKDSSRSIPRWWNIKRLSSKFSTLRARFILRYLEKYVHRTGRNFKLLSFQCIQVGKIYKYILCIDLQLLLFTK